MRVVFNTIFLSTIYCILTANVECDAINRESFDSKQLRRANSHSGRFQMARHDSKAQLSPLSQDDIDFSQMGVLEYIDMVDKFIDQNSIAATYKERFHDEYNYNALRMRRLIRIFSSSMSTKNGIVNIDISFPSLLKLAQKHLQKVVIESPEGLNEDQFLSLTHLKWIFSRFSKLFNAMKNSVPTDNLTKFGLTEENIKLIFKLTIGENRLFNIDEINPNRFKQILRYVIINPTGFQRVMSLLIVCILNKNIPTVFGTNLTGVHISLDDTAEGSYYDRIHHEIKLGYKSDSKFNIVKLASDLNHEMSHAYHCMIGLLSDKSDKFSLWLSNFFIINLQKSDYINMYFPMLKKKHMGLIIDRIKRLITPDLLRDIKSNQEKKNKILKYAKRIMLGGFGSVLFTKTENREFKNFSLDNILTEDFIARCIFVYASTFDSTRYEKYDYIDESSDLLWTIPEEKVTIQGNYVLLLGKDGHFKIEDRQNENAFNVRDSKSNSQGVNSAQYGYRLHLQDWSNAIKEGLEKVLRGILLTSDQEPTSSEIKNITDLIPQIFLPYGQKYINSKEINSSMDSTFNIANQLDYLDNGLKFYHYDDITELIYDIKTDNIDFGIIDPNYWNDTLFPELFLIDDDELIEKLIKKGVSPYMGGKNSGIVRCIKEKNLNKLKKLLSNSPKASDEQKEYVLEAFIDACPENNDFDSTMEQILDLLFSSNSGYFIKPYIITSCLIDRKTECLNRLLERMKPVNVNIDNILPLIADNYLENKANENIKKIFNKLFPPTDSKYLVESYTIEYCLRNRKTEFLRKILNRIEFSDINIGKVLPLILDNYSENDTNENIEQISRTILFTPEVFFNIKKFLSSNCFRIGRILALAIIKKATSVIDAVFVNNSDNWSDSVLIYPDFIDVKSFDFINQLKDKDIVLYNRIRKVCRSLKFEAQQAMEG